MVARPPPRAVLACLHCMQIIVPTYTTVWQFLTNSQGTGANYGTLTTFMATEGSVKLRLQDPKQSITYLAPDNAVSTYLPLCYIQMLATVVRAR